MSVNNNSTISAAVSGSSIAVDISVRFSIGGSNSKFKEDGYGYVMRSTNGGTYSKVSGNYSLPSEGGEGFIISKDILYTDTNVSNQNTYRYYFEMVVNEETAPPPGGGGGTEPL